MIWYAAKIAEAMATYFAVRKKKQLLPCSLSDQLPVLQGHFPYSFTSNPISL